MPSIAGREISSTAITVPDISATFNWFMTVCTVCTELISSPCTPLVRVKRLPGLAPLATITDTYQYWPVDICTPWKYSRCFLPGSRSLVFRKLTTFLPLITSPVYTVPTLLGAALALLWACARPMPVSAMAANHSDCMKMRQPRPPKGAFNIINSSFKARNP